MTRPTVKEIGDEARRVLQRLDDGLSLLDSRAVASQIGRVVDLGAGVATIAGVERPVAGELLDLDGVPARVEVAGEALVQVVVLSDAPVQANAPVRRTGRVLDVPVGHELMGRVVDPLGRPVDGKGALRTDRRTRLDAAMASLDQREPVSRPLRSGVLVVDTMIPIGRGQRQLIIGDRSTGKTELCLDLLAGLDSETVSVYVAIGRRGSEVSASLAWLAEHRFFERGFAVVAQADSPVGLVHLAPYSAMAMAEDLMMSGRDVVVVLDDLTTHAHAHRTLALLLGRPVGREAYPVDVFYAHARLLERSAQLSDSLGGGSLTALPVVETQDGDLAAYIPTNLVSITDGQIRLDAGLAAEGQVPAVDVGLSVSRVGGKAQPRLVRALSGRLKNRYAQFLEFEAFARFGTQVDESARELIDWGKRTRAALRQDRGVSNGWAHTVVDILVLRSGALTGVSLAAVSRLLGRAHELASGQFAELWGRLARVEAVEEAELAPLQVAIDELLIAEGGAHE